MRPTDPDRQEGDERMVFSYDERVRRGLPVPDFGIPKHSLAARGKLIAPSNRFRLVGVDTFSGPFDDFLVGDYEDKDDAIREASARGGKMKPYYVYDDAGTLVFSAGKP
jgi:hypothetical protein